MARCQFPLHVYKLTSNAYSQCPSKKRPCSAARIARYLFLCLACNCNTLRCHCDNNYSKHHQSMFCFLWKWAGERHSNGVKLNWMCNKQANANVILCDTCILMRTNEKNVAEDLFDVSVNKVYIVKILLCNAFFNNSTTPCAVSIAQ